METRAQRRRLEIAERLIRDAERLIARQRKLVASYRAAGFNDPHALRTLSRYLSVYRSQMLHRDWIAGEIVRQAGA